MKPEFEEYAQNLAEKINQKDANELDGFADDRNLEFNWQTTGQVILTFQAPPSFVSRINELYDDLMHKGKLINYSK